jgi:transcriptional regulator with GAF, ATPase, and Fis domain
MQPTVSAPNPIFILAEKIFTETFTSHSEVDFANFWPDPDHYWIGQNYFSVNWLSKSAADLNLIPTPLQETCLTASFDYLNNFGKDHRAKAYIIAEICWQIINNQNLFQYFYSFGDILASRSLGAGINERAISCLNELEIKNIKQSGATDSEIEKFEIKKLSMLAKAHRNLGNYERANDYYQLALSKANSVHDEFQIANQSYQLGKMYCNYLKQPERGIFQYKQAQSVFSKLNAGRMQAACLDDLGDSYRHHLKNYDQAEKYFRQALKINLQIKNVGGQSRNYAHLGLIAGTRGDLKKADQLLNRSIELLDNYPSERRGLGVRFGQMGELKMSLGDFESGVDLITKALLINREFNDRLTATKNLLKLAEIYSRRKDIETAILILNSTISLCQNQNSTTAYYRYPEQAKDCCYQLGNLHYEAGNYESARLHFIHGNSLLNHIWDDFLKEQLSPQKEINDAETVRMYQALLKQYNNESHENTNNINRILEKYHQKIIGLTRPNLRRELEEKYDIREVTSNSETLLKQLKYGLRAAKSNEPILLLGETGAGKEVFAKAIHLNSGRICPNRSIENSFAPINCGAIPSELVESELFGHKKGAFTGADRNKTGIFEEYTGGTVFLDEVADLPLPAQVKLLRFLQHKEIRPVGSTETKKVDVRIIAATNKNLEEEIQNHQFREDLYYRLNVIPVTVPSLRERPEDIDLLIDHILEDKLGLPKKERPQFSQKAMERLKNHVWRGNVRELENLLIRCIKIIDEDGNISEEDITCAFELSNNHLAPLKNKTIFTSAHSQAFGPVTIAVEKIPDSGIEIQSILKAIAEFLILSIAEQTNWLSLKQIAELAHLNYEKTKRILRRKEKTVKIKDINIT